jgi:hypothetical protein
MAFLRDFLDTTPSVCTTVGSIRTPISSSDNCLTVVALTFINLQVADDGGAESATVATVNISASIFFACKVTATSLGMSAYLNCGTATIASVWGRNCSASGGEFFEFATASANSVNLTTVVALPDSSAAASV